MKFKDRRLVAINVVAGLLIAGAAVSFVKHSFARPSFEVCSARYNRGTILGLEENGSPVAPSAIQASAFGHDRGVLDNLVIEPVAKAPAKHVMTIDVSGERNTSGGKPHPGVEFPWTPQSLTGVDAACLTYDVYIPENFAFADGAVLPGFYAITKNGGDYSDTIRVDTRLVWGAQGEAELLVYANGQTGEARTKYPVYDRTFPRGRWVRVEKEIVLNTPGVKNGIVRMWFNGNLETEVRAADLRDDANIAIAGVASIVQRKGRTDKPVETERTQVRISPYQVRWN
ncbi:MAG TPA: hypothetical protein PK970_01060 [Hyphomicrobiaceae bacterium]|nr:hypothetical protein [Hyphomicrobiaceae bacterium]